MVDKAEEGTTLNNIATIYQAQGDYTIALTYLTNSLAICQEIGDKAGEGTTLNNISQIYDAQRLCSRLVHSKSEKYYLKLCLPLLCRQSFG
jgi:tetratricopeptide (TPR) repeat protein